MATEGLSLPSSSTDRTSALLSQLDSGDMKSIEEVKAVIQENLHSSRDPGLLNALVEYYVQTHSPASLQILSSIHEARTQGLFEKMNECVKHVPSRLHTLTLLGHIVRRQPSWLYKIVKTTFFETLIKLLKGDTDILVLTSGILTVTTLLPLVPASIGPWLRDLFDIYTRLCAFRSFRKGNAPEVYHLHLHVAVYFFFHRLYAMYPNNFLVYLRTICGEPSKQSLFEGTIKPMLEHVRFHPCILTETTVTETEKHRWRKKEPHDIVTECMKVSLDPVDRMQEDGGFTTSSASRQSRQETLADKSINSVLNMSGDAESFGPESVRLKERRMSDSATQTGKSLQSGDSGTDSCSNPIISADEMTPGWSPSEVCGLTTPPSSQMSPATSNPDLVSSLTTYSHCSTPVAIYTPGQSPTASLGGDVACTQVSNFPSLLASKGKITGISHAHSGRLTPVRGVKAVSHEGQLTRALYSVLAQTSREEVLSAPAVLGVQHTSTPKGSESYDHNIQVISSEGHHSIENSTPTTQTSNSAGNIETQEDGNSVALRTSGEHVDSSHCNKVSPKEEFRDSEEQLHNFASENEDVKSLESHLSVLSSDCSRESVTPVGCQSLDSVSLPNTPVEFEEMSDNDFASANDVKNNDVEHKARCDSDSSLLYGEHEHQDPSPEKDHNFPSVVVGKTSVTAENVLLDSAQTDGSGSFEQQNHHGFHSCDLFAPFLRATQSDTGHVSTGDEMGVQATRCRPELSQASPIEILDSYLKIGCSVHYSELARIPLVSQSGTDWTHFGGEPPVDEVEILRGQVQLLHNQLLFERHKCELHAVRNRRLIGKTFKAVQFQEELQATKDQLRLQEEKMRELTEALNKQAEDSRRSKEITSSWDHHQQTKLRNLVNENTQLRYAKEELQNILVAQQEDFDAKEMEVHQLQARVFALENEMEKLKEELSEKHHLTGQVDHLVKELLIMGELNQSQKDTIKKLSSVEGQNPESNMQYQACHKELTAAKQTIKKQKTELEALTAKLADMESTLSNKDNEIKGLKKLTESMKGTYIGQLQSLEEKYVSQKRITQALESYILDLQSSLPTEQSTEKEEPVM